MFQISESLLSVGTEKRFNQSLRRLQTGNSYYKRDLNIIYE